ncbi:MAG: dipeptidase [Anaerolineaceae bacterium]
MTFIIDSHQDLGINMLTYGRDYTRSAAETRQLEVDTPIPQRNGQTLLGWPDYQAGQVAIVFSTIFIAPKRYQNGDWDNYVFSNNQEYGAIVHRQLDAYARLVDNNPDKFRFIKTSTDLESVMLPWFSSPASLPDNPHPVGLVLLVEGAEGLRDMDELEEWSQAGVRIIGPVWAGTRFCGGTLNPQGTFTKEGFTLLESMAGLDLTLDISHMNETSALTALDVYSGKVIASHANVRRLLNEQDNERHFTDLTIRRLVERGGVMGVVPFARFLDPDWRSSPDRKPLPLTLLVNHIDAICQIAGSADHAAIGTDFDGGFGWPDVPDEIDTIADMQKITGILETRGYSAEDISKIMGGNWLRFLQSSLPKS